MLFKRIIPCLDVKDGRVVKGVQFLGLKDAGDPVEAAKRYNEEGADELTFLDITASHEKRQILIDVVTRTAEQVFIPLTVGGGVRTIGNIRSLLRAGADKVSINTAAVENPQFVREASDAFGSQCVVAAVDVKCVNLNELSASPVGVPHAAPNFRWEVFTHGGRRATGIEAIAWCDRLCREGAGEILLTSMDRDGKKEGYDLELTRRVSETVGVPVIASGGVGTLEHLYDGFARGKADAVLAASIFHFGEHSIREAKKYLHKRGICVRPT